MVAANEAIWAVRVRQALNEQGRKQDWLAKSMGVSESMVSRWMHGTRNQSEEQEHRMAHILGVPWEWIFQDGSS